MICACGNAFDTKSVDAIARAEYDKKIALERTFKREIKTLFRRMLNDFRIAVAATGRPQGSKKYVGAWDAALRVQYARVQRAFRGQVTTQAGNKAWAWSVKQDAGDAFIDMELLDWAERFAPEQADYIAATSDEDMAASVDGARSSIAADGGTLDNRTIAAVAMALLAQRFAGRTNTIAQTSTQSAAETTKYTEATAAGSQRDAVFVNPDAQPIKITKTWVTVGDSRVRPSHVAINGTTLPNDGIFVLNTGSRLRFAGDMLLGAAIGDIINCRCTTRYEG